MSKPIDSPFSKEYHPAKTSGGLVHCAVGIHQKDWDRMHKHCIAHRITIAAFIRNLITSHLKQLKGGAP